jgi:hypothetical protein
MNPYYPNNPIRESGTDGPGNQALVAVSMMAASLGPALFPYLEPLLDEMFAGGLSELFSQHHTAL